MIIHRPPSKITRPDDAKVVFKGKLFDVWQWEHMSENGSSVTFESLSRPDTVLVLPVLDRDFVLFAEEKQPGMEKMFRAIGGRVAEGESPLVAVQRELMEESGYSAGKLLLWDAWQPVNKIDWTVYLFIAHNIRKVATQQLDSTENITIRQLAIDDLFGPSPKIDDYELLCKLNFAKTNSKELSRVKALFTSNNPYADD